MIDGTVLQTDLRVWQLSAAAVVLAAIAIAAVVIRYSSIFASLPEEQAREKRGLIGQREDQTPQTLRIPAGEDPEDYREAIRSLFDRSQDIDQIQDRATLRDGFKSIRKELRTLWGQKTERVPNLSLAYAEEAIAIAVLGLLATVGLETVEEIFATGSADLSPSVVTESGIEALQSAAETGVSTVSAFPFAGDIWALTFAGAVLLAEFLFYNPLVSAVTLAVFAVLIGFLERQVPEAVDIDLFDRRSLLVGGIITIATTWLAGAIPASIGAALGAPVGGAVVGMVFAIGVFSLGAWIGIGLARQRIQYLSLKLDGQPQSIVAYVLLQRLSIAIAGVLIPLIPIYVVYLLISGRLVAVVGAYLQGSLLMQVLLAIVVGTLVAIVAYQVRDTWPELRAGFEETFSRQAIKIAFIARGIPVAIVVFAGLVAYSFAVPLPLVIAVALFAGLVTRGSIAIAARLKRKSDLIEREPVTANRVVISAYVLETTSGEERYYATVNTTRLAHQEKGALVDAIVQASHALFEDGDVEPSIEQQFAIDLFELGVTDINETRVRLYERARLICNRTFSKRGKRVESETLEQLLSKDVPEPIYRSYLSRRLNQQELRHRDGYYAIV
ncbi:hypothetical protein [Natronocalculus amylovorans]|uniref:Uncharacterized protein n=1 Tax=Natronocalculus amylovorans TaxID=2917812 RepID=A0AAE3K9G8_9EURY|nr:hypothetical protein [Natronocalculus amylovorans]MCL9818337.1 hypothetical protein [Natronocalculus amylovorans]